MRGTSPEEEGECGGDAAVSKVTRKTWVAQQTLVKRSKVMQPCRLM